jgi:hypothetical protein
LLRHGVAGGAVLLASASAVSALAAPASAATIPDNDLAYVRLLIGAELLAADFQTHALASGELGRASTAVVKRMLADEQAHYGGLANLMALAGQTPASAGDINFTYPKGSFDFEASVLKLAASLENLALGAYLGAIENVQTPEWRLPIGQIAANEAQHVSALATASGRSPIGHAFAPSLPIATVSAALDAYES